jgi:hypothetical protein
MFDSSTAADAPTWAEMAPGPELAALLEDVDLDALDEEGEVAALQALARLVAHYQAAFYRAMAVVGDATVEAGPAGSSTEFAGDEVAAALTWTRRAAEGHLWFAWHLLRLPDVFAALAAGHIDLPRARVIVEETDFLPDEQRAEIVAAVLEDADLKTTGQLAAWIRRLRAQVRPEAEAERYEQAVERRRVIAEPTLDGSANIYLLDVPADRAAAIMGRVGRLAHQVKTAGDPRTFEQVRTDVALDVLEGVDHGGPASSRGVVDIRVDLATLVYLDEGPAEIPGWGPVISDIARKVTERPSTWQVAVTDPDTGRLLWAGTTRRRPTTDQRRRVSIRRPRCVFPGCRTPASRADLDHTVAFADGGPTTDDNLAPLCRHHHRMKHEAGWALSRTYDDCYRWTSPLGRTYTVEPQGP